MADEMLGGHRRHRRYRIRGDVFIGSGPFFHTVGTLKDISKGGAAFEYTVSSGTGRPKTTTLVVDILCRKQFRLSRLSCRVAYDISTEQTRLDGIETRRCGLEFGRLSDQHAALLNLLLSGSS
jgi:hypothetical protein